MSHNSHEHTAGYSSVVIEDVDFRRMEARLKDLLPRLNERDRRVALAVEARALGHGGISAVHRATEPPSHRATEPPSHRATEPPGLRGRRFDKA